MAPLFPVSNQTTEGNDSATYEALPWTVAALGVDFEHVTQAERIEAPFARLPVLMGWGRLILEVQDVQPILRPISRLKKPLSLPKSQSS